MIDEIKDYCVYMTSMDYTWEDDADITLDYLEVLTPEYCDIKFEYEPSDGPFAKFKNKDEAIAFADKITSIKMLLDESEYKKLPKDFHIEVCIEAYDLDGDAVERIYERSLYMRDEK